MAKTIAQQVREKVKETAEKSGIDVPEEARDAVGFIASATPQADDAAVGANTADAPEADATAPLESAAPSAEATEHAPGSAPPLAKSPDSSTPPSIPSGQTTSGSEEEWEDAEWDDDSVNFKYRIKAPKGTAEKIKAGWMAHADYSRKAARLARFQQEFQPAIESGYMEQVLPLYRALDRDEVLAKAVAALYQQRMSNQPLSYVQPGFEQHFQQPQQQTQPQVQEEQAYGDDPYLQGIMQPIQRELGEMRTYLQQQAQTAEQQRVQAQQAEAARATQLAEWGQIHRQLVQAYPGEYTGDQRDLPKLQQLAAYADRAGLTRDYYGPLGRILEAKRAIDAATPRAGTPTAVTSAGAAAVQAQAEEIARRARAEVANGTVVSGSPQPAEPATPKPPRLRDKEGRPLPVRRAMQNIINSARARAEAGS